MTRRKKGYEHERVSLVVLLGLAKSANSDYRTKQILPLAEKVDWGCVLT